MADARFIFTVTAGRSGQASLTDLLRRHVPHCLAYFEEPRIEVRLPSALGDLERHFRRRFVETHELLGRGRVLAAFDTGDEAALAGYAAQRLAWIDRHVARHGARLYVDVSKYFARGMHRAIVRARPGVGLIRLVRDPILNMRSFLNRNKSFYLDNNRPDGAHNELRLDPEALTDGELYLWAWCEMYLRYDALVEEFDPSAAVEIRTEDLNDATRMTEHLSALGLEHEPVAVQQAQNTNASGGYGPTAVNRNDVETFERFCDRLPAQAMARIVYFGDYDPRAKFAAVAA